MRNNRTKRACQVCGEPFYGSGDCHYCPTCARIKKSDRVVKIRTCQDCGVEFYGGPRARRCPDCAYKAQQETNRKHKKTGTKRPLGSTDKCVICGKEYTVVSGRQKYCSDACQHIGVLEWQREHRREYNKSSGQDEKKRERREAQEKICVYCLRPFKSSSPTNLCSDYCREEQRKLNQCIADINRGYARDLKRYEAARDACREEILRRNKMSYLQKIEIVKSYTDDDLRILTSKKRLIVKKIKDGENANAISQSLDCSASYVHKVVDDLATKKFLSQSGAPVVWGRNCKSREIFLGSSDLSVLSEQERQIVNLYIEDDRLTYAEVGERLGIPKGVVSYALNRARKKCVEQGDTVVLSHHKNQNIKMPDRASSRRRYNDKAIFLRCSDFSSLTKQEHQIVDLCIKDDGLTYAEIGEKLGIPIKSVGSLLSRARKKCAGEWEEERIKRNNKQKEYREAHLEATKEAQKEYYLKNREKLVENMKNYNREYYLKNRERILEKKRQKKK